MITWSFTVSFVLRWDVSSSSNVSLIDVDTIKIVHTLQCVLQHCTIRLHVRQLLQYRSPWVKCLQYQRNCNHWWCWPRSHCRSHHYCWPQRHCCSRSHFHQKRSRHRGSSSQNSSLVSNSCTSLRVWSHFISKLTNMRQNARWSWSIIPERRKTNEEMTSDFAHNCLIMTLPSLSSHSLFV